MLLLVFFLTSIFITIGVGVQAALSDVRTLTIPNMSSVIVIATFFLAYGILYIGGGPSEVFGPLTSHLLSAFITFVVTAILFAVRMIGAGDSKFATACALWLGVADMPIFLFYMTLCGAGLGAAALYMQRKKPFKSALAGGWVDQVQGGASKVPYGVAITFGMVIAFWYAGYFSSDVMQSFLPSAGVGGSGS